MPNDRKIKRTFVANKNNPMFEIEKGDLIEFRNQGYQHIYPNRNKDGSPSKKERWLGIPNFLVKDRPYYFTETTSGAAAQISKKTKNTGAKKK